MFIFCCCEKSKCYSRCFSITQQHLFYEQSLVNWKYDSILIRCIKLRQFVVVSLGYLDHLSFDKLNCSPTLNRTISITRYSGFIDGVKQLKIVLRQNRLNKCHSFAFISRIQNEFRCFSRFYFVDETKKNTFNCFLITCSAFSRGYLECVIRVKFKF